ncbi:MAG: cation:proton antiporter [Alphaproteobacteria bacterium]
MDSQGFALIAFTILAFALVSGRADRFAITPPMVFALFGLAAGAQGLGLIDLSVDHAAIHLLAEITLIIVLFTDAARIDFRKLRSDYKIPMRMLIIGMPLTILAGLLMALPLFPGFSLWEAALLAAILTPTDAALGQSVVTSPAVPARIRQALNVESGLNDGIALPVIILFLCLAVMGQHDAPEVPFLVFGLMQITLGPLVGAGVGFAGGWLLERSIDRALMAEAFQGVAAIALALLAYGAAELAGGNGFIAAFVAGLTLGNTTHHCPKFVLEFAEAEGQLLALFVFMIFGAVLVPDLMGALTWPAVLYAVLALTIMRMVPVAFSLIGTRLWAPTVLFLGWFGPRGLASILFALVVLDEGMGAQMTGPMGEMGVSAAREIIVVTILTVALSILAHGLTAAPFSALYGRSVSARKDGAVSTEMQPSSDLPTRYGRRQG